MYISELPQKEKSAHNMIRIPAWIFGGWWVLTGISSFAVLFIFKMFDIIAIEEIGDYSALFDSVISISLWTGFMTFGLGLIYLLLGFLYHRFIENGKKIVLGIAFITLVSVVLTLIISLRFYSEDSFGVLEDFPSDEIDMQTVFMIQKSILFFSMFFSLMFRLIPAIFAYVGFSRLKKNMDDKVIVE